MIPLKRYDRTDRIRYIEISVGRTFVDEDTGEDETDSGTHLIVFPYEEKPYESCAKTSFTSDPAIINYYRQFFIRLNERVIDSKDGFLVEILSKLSRTGVRKLTKGFSTIRKFGVYRSFEFINYSCFWWSECDC